MIVTYPRPRRRQPELTLFFDAVEDVDPVVNTHATAGAPEEQLSFPFVASQQDLERIGSKGIADDL